MPKGVVFLPSFYEAIENLPDKDRLEAYDAIIRYGLYGEERGEYSQTVRLILLLVKPVIDASKNQYEASIKNGKKGGRPRGNQRRNQRQNQNQNQTGNQTGNQEIEKDTDREREKESDMEAEEFEDGLEFLDDIPHFFGR